ncbi:FAD-dependent oxidoreductase [Ramlibacter sp. MAHUQ-53]|uniref:FAD-dependent oxidoreductase n=1 Tax=unclassified Ramlibacter TaxID=2617605 RepID=UPI003627D730
MTATPSPTAAGKNEIHCDLLVIGSGAGGLATAATAAHLGLKVIVAEKDPQFGGTTAWSGGWMWIPRNPLAREAGIEEDLEGPLAYLRHELGAQFDEARVNAFLAHGPRMVDFFRRHTALQFIDGNAIPDFHGRSPGAALGGRSVCAAPFDARRLGARMHDLKPPLRETTLWGLGIASGAELRHYLNALRKPASFWYVARRVMRYAWDYATHRRASRVVNGNALVAALAASALERGVRILTASPAQRLLRHGQRIEGAVLSTPQGEVTVRARRGVVLATGGFPHDATRQRQLVPHVREGHGHWSAANRGNTGDGLRLGEAAGGQVAQDLVQAMALAPVSLVPRADGSTGHFPHLIERAKPGVIAVRRDGRRYCNEADSYHDVMQALLRATPPGEKPEAWLVCDHAFIRRYGLGAVKPAPMPLGPWLASGYLKRADTLAALAAACGIDAGALAATVDRYNAMAREGRDADFGKGDTPYNRVQGEPEPRHPNPCMAPLERGPFYAVKLVMGSLGSFAGLRVGVHGEVLDARGEPIAGLYAAGNDMSSMMGGNYPSGGITLGPAMTFGYLAAHHAAGRALATD